MLHFNFSGKKDSKIKVLCLGAHSDDIEIGCGGSILRLQEEYSYVEVDWVVVGAHGTRNQEAVESAGVFLRNAENKNIEILNFNDGYFPYIGAEIKDYFESLKSRVSPDLIFTHNRHDLHQDHRLVSELTWNTFRNHLILEYEIFKYDGDLGTPNFYISLTKEQVKEKVETILRIFRTQAGRHWFTRDVFYSLWSSVSSFRTGTLQ